MMKAWRTNRYDFVLQCAIVGGYFGFFTKKETFGLETSDIAIGVSFVLWFIYRKAPILRRTLFFILVYFAGMLIIASFSLETITRQLFMMRRYWGIAFIIVPFVVFARREFKFHDFCSRVLIYSLFISGCYAIDGFVLKGNVLVPQTYIGNWTTSTFYSLVWNPMSMTLFRKYPLGMLFISLLIYPLSRYYRLRWWQYLIIFVGLMATMTFTVIIAYLSAYILFQGKPLRVLKIAVGGLIALFLLYVIDGFLPTDVNDDGIPTSTLRIHGSIQQFIDLTEAVDDEDLAKFASGRLAQILPRATLIEKEGRQLTGLGFLHPEKSKFNRYVIENEYYSDVTESEEFAVEVEVMPVQIYIHMGWLGLIWVTLFYTILYFIVRKLKYHGYFGSLLYISTFIGFGGWMGPFQFVSLGLTCISFAVPILVARKELPGFSEIDQSSKGGK